MRIIDKKYGKWQNYNIMMREGPPPPMPGVPGDAPDDPEFREHINLMFERLRLIRPTASRIPEGEKGSFKWRSQAGLYWWRAREVQARCSRYEAAERAGVDISAVRLLEFGLGLDDKELNPHWLEEYSSGEVDFYLCYAEASYAY